MPRTHRLGLLPALAWLAFASAPAHAQDPVVTAAGDIACSAEYSEFNGGEGSATECRQHHVSDLVLARNPTAVFALGDLQYNAGTLTEFQGSYNPSWGQFKDKTYPVVGNHEYLTPGAGGYFDYFNGVGNDTGRAGDRDEGWYSFDIGAWHIVALNSMCDEVGGCQAGSPQEQWLREDLAANADASCTLAMWHHPRFNSGPNQGNFPRVADFWQALHDAGADVVLSGHAHVYERFAPQDAQGNADPARGLREFVVGTGGRSHGLTGELQPNSEVRDDDNFGALELALRAGSYEWKFLGETGSVLDQGAAGCHNAPPDAPPQTSIASGPEGLTKEREASFTFASSKPGSTFRCTLDGPGATQGDEAGCASPAGYAGLADGTYTFSVRALDPEGNPDPEPATRSFTVDASPPDTSITSGPETSTRATGATVSFASPDADARFECRLDSGAWTACASPASYAGLTGGSHTFQARAVDPAGNADPSPAAHSWSIELAQAFRPSAYRVLTGSVFRDKGSIRRLYRNDRWRLKIAAAEKRRRRHVARVEIAIAAGVGDSATLYSLRLAYDGGATARRAKVVVRVLNRRTQEWVKAFARRGRRDRSLEWSAAAVAGDYLSRRGTMRVRIKAKGLRPFRTRTDLVRLTVQY